MRRLALALLLPVAACGKQPPALPAQLQIEEFPVPWVDAFPSDIAVDRQGHVWFTDRMTHAIGRFDPETATFTRFPTPTARSAPYGLVTGPDGALWFAESTVGKIGRVDVATGGITEVSLPELANGGGPHLLAYSGDRIWFTAREAIRWGWYEPATGRAATYPLGVAQDTPISRWRAIKPYSIAPAIGGGAWIGTYDGAHLLRARPGVDTLEEHLLVRELPVDSAMVARMQRLPDSVRARLGRIRNVDAVGARRSAADASGNLWLADFQRGRVVRYYAAGDTFETHASLTRNAGPYGIGVDPWGRVWYHEVTNRSLVMLDPRTGERTAIPVRQHNAAIRHIGFDRERRRVWLPISDAGVIGLIRLR